MNRKLSILFTNLGMDRYAGTETVIRDLSLGMLQRGYRPIVYSPHLGPPAQWLTSRGVAVISDLTRLAEPPDVIHGQHFIQTAEAMLHFPQTPAVQMCHAWASAAERPAAFPQIHRYIAVDDAVRDRLLHTEGIDPARIEVLYNAVDLERIPGRRGPLPPKPLRALAFTKFSGHLPFLRSACQRHGIELDVLGHGGERVLAHPERELVKYDLVFATARMALEAICAGCAVIVCDSRGLAGMVTTNHLPRLRALNFGLRTLTGQVSTRLLSREIERYDPADAQNVSAQVRKSASLPPLLDRMEALYAEAMASPPSEPVARLAAERLFLNEALPRVRNDTRWPWIVERQDLLNRIAQLERALASSPVQGIDPLPDDGQI